MDPALLDDELSRDPFVPLVLTLNTGEKIEVRDPDRTVISHLSLYVFEKSPRGGRLAKSVRLISLRHILQVEKLQPA